MGWAGIRGSRGEREDRNEFKPIGGSAIGTSLGTGHYSDTNAGTSNQSPSNAGLGLACEAISGAISDLKPDSEYGRSFTSAGHPDPLGVPKRSSYSGIRHESVFWGR